MSKIQKALEHVKSYRPGPAAKRPSYVAPSNDAPNLGQPAALPPDYISLSSIPTIQFDADMFKRNRLVLHNTDERHPAQGAYRMLRTRLMKVMRNNNWRVLGVSSIGPGEGKTFTTINLAISIAAETGQEAILVDLDLRRPSVHRCMGIGDDSFVSIRDYFQNAERDLSDLLICPSINRLGCLLSSDPLVRSSDILASARGRQLFSELRDRTDPSNVIIVDLPPLLATDDALAVAPMLDALLLVVAEGQAERSDLMDIQQITQEFNLIGTVLNKSIEKDSKRVNYY